MPKEPPGKLAHAPLAVDHFWLAKTDRASRLWLAKKTNFGWQNLVSRVELARCRATQSGSAFCCAVELGELGELEPSRQVRATRTIQGQESETRAASV